MREVTNQLQSNARLYTFYSSLLSICLKCASLQEQETEVGSPFQIVGAVRLEAQPANEDNVDDLYRQQSVVYVYLLCSTLSRQKLNLN